MTNGNEGGTENGENPETDSPLNKFEILEKLELVVAETEKIAKSHKRKFDEITEKLQAIEGSVSKISKLDKKLDSKKEFVLKHVIKNAKNWKEGDWSQSKEEEHFNLKWHIDIGSEGGHLGFFVLCKPTATTGDLWSIDSKLEFKMMGDDYSNVIKTMTNCFGREDIGGFDSFLTWEDVGYQHIDDDLIVEVKVEILEITGSRKKKIRDFGESQKDVSDVVLVVQDTKFYVLKMFLALQSSYFKSLFFGKFDESEMKEIKLNGIEIDDFQNFLELIHGESSIDDDTVTGILQLADMYDAPTAIRRCEEFLLKNSEKTIVQKLQLALRCNLKNLKNKCLSEVTTISHIESILAADLPEMDLSTSQTLLRKSVAFSNK
ncbi:unnamed protein product [Caenorhabditis nigoni]